MKIGDLVKWCGYTGGGRAGQTGIIVDGPRKGRSGDQPATRYAVAWFNSPETMWHLDFNMEVLNENR